MTGISIYISKVKQLLQSKQSGISNRKIAKTLEISRNKANEFGLIPAKILKDDKEEYIKSLIASREEEDLNIFRDFMTSMLEKNLSDEINSYIMSIGESEEYAALKPMKTRDKIIALLTEDGKQSATTLAEKIGVSAKAIEKQLAKLKADGLIERKGPAKGGAWLVITKMR